MNIRRKLLSNLSHPPAFGDIAGSLSGSLLFVGRPAGNPARCRRCVAAGRGRPAGRRPAGHRALDRHVINLTRINQRPARGRGRPRAHSAKSLRLAPARTPGTGSTGIMIHRTAKRHPEPATLAASHRMLGDAPHALGSPYPLENLLVYQALHSSANNSRWEGFTSTGPCCPGGGMRGCNDCQ